jgi:hypothetical protein
MVLLTLVVFAENSEEHRFFEFELQDGPAAALAARGVTFLRLSCDRTTAAREAAAHRNAEPEQRDIFGRIPSRGSEHVLPAYEDAAVRELADLIGRWCDNAEAPRGDARGNFVTGPKRMDGDAVEAPRGAPALTVFYATTDLAF